MSTVYILSYNYGYYQLGNRLMRYPQEHYSSKRRMTNITFVIIIKERIIRTRIKIYVNTQYIIT